MSQNCLEFLLVSTPSNRFEILQGLSTKKISRTIHKNKNKFGYLSSQTYRLID